MYKRILAAMLAAIMVLGMSMTTMAAGSPSVSSKDVELLVKVDDNHFHQQFGTDSLAFFAKDTTVNGKPVTEAPVQRAKDIVTFCKETWGQDVFIASIFCVDLPDRSASAAPTDLTNALYNGKSYKWSDFVTSSNVWKGQEIAVVVQTGPLTFEILSSGMLEDGLAGFEGIPGLVYALVAFPFGSPKTGDYMVVVMAVMAVLFGMSAVVCAKKAKNI